MMSKDYRQSPAPSHTPARPYMRPHRVPALQLLYTRPYRGELPDIAGSLLYPDAPAKMESTSQRAFCLRPGPQPERGRGLQGSLTLEGNRCFLTTQRESYLPHPLGGAPRTARRRRQKGREEREEKDGAKDGEEEEEEEERRGGVGTGGVGAEEEEEEKVLSQYQQDFRPPSDPRRRKRSLFVPQPDNIAINPALRTEFRTVQRDAYPVWSLTQYYKPITRLRASGQPSTYPK